MYPYAEASLLGFVGREKELDALGKAWSDTLEGSVQYVHIHWVLEGVRLA